MRASTVVAGLVSAVAVLGGLPGTLAQSQDGLWARLRRAIGGFESSEKKAIDYSIYGEPAPEKKAYSYPPYGYPPPPPPTTTTSPAESATSTTSSGGKYLNFGGHMI